MKITVNGETVDVPANCTISDLVQHLGLSGRRLAVEVNQDIVPRSKHPSHKLEEHDVVEVVQAIGGG